ncbi:MAG: hypothetical protein QOE90_3089 [Thermoplasmata archaeon]|jgi:hypothetical protein|nr:hypothetical protein [Thermoplasmata archaeon]
MKATLFVTTTLLCAVAFAFAIAPTVSAKCTGIDNIPFNGTCIGDYSENQYTCLGVYHPVAAVDCAGVTSIGCCLL